MVIFLAGLAASASDGERPKRWQDELSL